MVMKHLCERHNTPLAKHLCECHNTPLAKHLCERHNTPLAKHLCERHNTPLAFIILFNTFKLYDALSMSQLYREESGTGNVFMAFSSDSTCSSGLRSAAAGYETFSLSVMPATRWPSQVDGSNCR
jgi:hypothetical protein